MSAVESIPKVQSVSSALVKEASCAAIVVSAGLAVLMLRALSAGAKHAYRAYTLPTSRARGDVKPLSGVRQDGSVFEARFENMLEQSAISPTEKIQLKTLLTLEQAPLFVQSKATLEQNFDLLSRATSPEEAEKHRRELFDALGTEHQQVLGGALSLACATAAKKIGFGAIETKKLSLECTRIIATDPAGRSLVTEIQNPKDKEPSIETEIVGVSDGSCNAILDTFVKAVKEEGVRSAPSSRKYTGGVCELAAARDFIRKKVLPNKARTAPAAVSDQKSAQQRQLRLMNQQKQKTKG